MKTFAILLLAQAAVPAAVDDAPARSPEVENQIVVIGERMKEWEGGIAKVDGELTCRIKKSTGDPLIDAIRCGSMMMCVGPLAPQIDEIANSDIGRKEKTAKITELTQSALPCMEEYHEKAVARLAETRVDTP